MTDKKPDIATKTELDRLLADRENDPPVPELNHPRPSWVDDNEDPRRVHMRMRERRINHLESRLDGAAQKVERDFDQSR
ncbi:MAG: hypothetical protein ABJN40_07405 [Sneathiella sp.]